MKTLILLMSCLATPLVGQDIFVLGEVHDNPAHHLEQALRISEIGPSAVVYEMLTPAMADIVNQSDNLDPALGDKIGWEEAGWPDFTIYAPVFAASDAPVYGAALPRAQIMGAIGKGAAAVFGSHALDYGLGPLPAEVQADFEQEINLDHCEALPQEMWSGMVEAQRLRDAHFAKVALQALEDTGGPVVVITGNGHARNDRAIPAVIALARPDVAVTSLGILESDDQANLYDEVVITDPAEREDPCLAFR